MGEQGRQEEVLVEEQPMEVDVLRGGEEGAGIWSARSR